jgi:hypothetical protein
MGEPANDSVNLTDLLDWEYNLSASEHIVLETAYKLYMALQLPGTCYNSTFFLSYYLKKRFGIDGHVEVGFVSDGINEHSPSHAWFVYKGEITDLGLSRPLSPTRNRPGPLTILGRDLISGWKWNYYTAQSPEGQQALATLCAYPSYAPNDFAAVAKRTHIEMTLAAQSTTGIRRHLDRSPRGMNYHDLVILMNKISLNGAYENASMPMLQQPANNAPFALAL